MPCNNILIYYQDFYFCLRYIRNHLDLELLQLYKYQFYFPLLRPVLENLQGGRSRFCIYPKTE